MLQVPNVPGECQPTAYSLTQLLLNRPTWDSRAPPPHPGCHPESGVQGGDLTPNCPTLTARGACAPKPFGAVPTSRNKEPGPHLCGCSLPVGPLKTAVALCGSGLGTACLPRAVHPPGVGSNSFLSDAAEWWKATEDGQNSQAICSSSVFCEFIFKC